MHERQRKGNSKPTIIETVTKGARLGVRGVANGATVIGRGAKSVAKAAEILPVVKHTRRKRKKLVRQDSTQAWFTRLTPTTMYVEVSFECRNIPKKNILSFADAFCVLWEVPVDYTSKNPTSFAGDTIGKSRRRKPKRLPSKQEIIIGHTETIRNQNPTFTTKFRILFNFELEQKYIVRVYDKDLRLATDLEDHEYLGGATFNLGQLIGSKGSTLMKPLISGHCPDSNNAYLAIVGREIDRAKDYFNFRFNAEILQIDDDVNEKCNPYFKLELLEETDQTWDVKFKSEVIKNSTTPTWNEVTLPMQLLLNNYDSNSIGGCGFLKNNLRISIWCYHKKTQHEILGYTEIPIVTLLDGAKNGIAIHDIMKETRTKMCFGRYKIKKKGYLNILKASVTHSPSMIAYLNGGCKIDVAIAVDYSLENGPRISDDATGHGIIYDLHRRTENNLNDYQATIRAIGSTIGSYSKQEQCDMVGFGASIKNRRQPIGQHYDVSRKPFFPIAYNARGANGLLKAYNEIFDNTYINMHDSADLKPLIETAVFRSIQLSRNEQSYSIFCILTAGAIADLKSAFDVIITASDDAPLSIIFLGVGNGNFSALERICNESYRRRLLHTNGVPISRNIVSFAHFKDYDYSKPELMLSKTKEVVADALYNIPEQMISYFTNNGMKPNPPVPVPDTNDEISLLDDSIVTRQSKKNKKKMKISRPTPNCNKKRIRTKIGLDIYLQ